MVFSSREGIFHFPSPGGTVVPVVGSGTPFSFPVSCKCKLEGTLVQSELIFGLLTAVLSVAFCVLSYQRDKGRGTTVKK
jgi:hypothetical protein